MARIAGLSVSPATDAYRTTRAFTGSSCGYVEKCIAMSATAASMRTMPSRSDSMPPFPALSTFFFDSFFKSYLLHGTGRAWPVPPRGRGSRAARGRQTSRLCPPSPSRHKAHTLPAGARRRDTSRMMSPTGWKALIVMHPNVSSTCETSRGTISTLERRQRATTLFRKSTRLFILSISTKCTSGMRIARTMPGSPAPLPRSATRASEPMQSAITGTPPAQSSICLVTSSSMPQTDTSPYAGLNSMISSTYVLSLSTAEGAHSRPSMSSPFSR